MSTEEENQEEVSLLQLYKKLTVEGKWFLRALQHVNSKLRNRVEVRLYISVDGDYVSVITRTSTIILEFLRKHGTLNKGDQNKIHFHFERGEKDCDDGELIGMAWTIADWDMPVTESGKAIVRGFWEILSALPYDLTIAFELNRFMEKVKALDDLIRKEKALIHGKEITQNALKEWCKEISEAKENEEESH
jgi:hypothetical protein